MIEALRAKMVVGVAASLGIGARVIQGRMP
jgi:hypothetical protein